MANFEVSGPASTVLRIAYDVEGDGPPIVLVHGFASNRATNWKATGWYTTLEQAGRRVVALDVRGHGESDKAPDPVAYHEGELARDVGRPVGQLSNERDDVVG